MKLTSRSWWAIPLAAGIAVMSCKKVEPPSTANDDPMVASIELQGLKKLEHASAFSAIYAVTGAGVTVRGKLKHKAGAMRVEHVIPYGDRVIEVAAQGRCWRQRGQVVIPCDRAESAHATRLASLLEAAWLWPLKQRPDRKVTATKVDLAGKTHPALTILGGTGQPLGTLLFDPANYLVVGLRMQTTLGGKTGELVGTFSAFEKSCGIKIAGKREYTFLGQPLLTEKISGVLCEPIDDDLFAQPPQVKHGHLKLKHKGTTDLVCTRLRGPLTGVDAAIGKVSSGLSAKGFGPVGAPVLIHEKGPPRVKAPGRLVTAVCLPVGKRAWVMPEGTWTGELFVKQVVGDEVLAAFGVGDVIKNTGELPGLLLAGARERKRKQLGVMVQILYLYREDFRSSRPHGALLDEAAETPPDQRVSEMHATLE